MTTGKKALDYLNNCEVFFSDKSEDEDNQKLESAQIFIQTPVNCNGINRNIDSVYKNVADRDASLLSGNQLLECNVLEMKLRNLKVERGKNDE